MAEFTELFQSPQGLVTMVFILVSVSIYSGGGSYGESMLMGGLGLIKIIPLALLEGISTAVPFFAPIGALIFLWFLGNLRISLGAPIFALILVSSIVLLLGA